MSYDKVNSFHIRFTGKNYSVWKFQFKLFVKGKELWGHIDGSTPAPQEHKGGIRVETCVLSSALVVKLLVILLGIVLRSSVTTVRNKVISSLLVPFDLKGSKIWHRRLSHPNSDVLRFLSILTIFSLTSIVTFLSILSSPFRFKDFKHTLPDKLMIGLITFLFLSVTMLMVAFGATIILMIYNKESYNIH
ncbi:hypothetical protein POTOM_016541 [Populus tomentosa]|uniref:Retrotransposon Copia-like N-terminal domain-containing protein n=1 Tax=Populus tomentosa TaxID=118781 RepID=A0A8X7ZSY9_POPTO|nr:hypothetical protein POTOM_016541 [Populus tomentosa]